MRQNGGERRKDACLVGVTEHVIHRSDLLFFVMGII